MLSSHSQSRFSPYHPKLIIVEYTHVRHTSRHTEKLLEPRDFDILNFNRIHHICTLVLSTSFHRYVGHRNLSNTTNLDGPRSFARATTPGKLAKIKKTLLLDRSIRVRTRFQVIGRLTIVKLRNGILPHFSRVFVLGRRDRSRAYVWRESDKIYGPP